MSRRACTQMASVTWALLGVAWAVLWLASNASAAQLEVTNTDDSGAGSLRAALTVVNDTADGDAGPHEIDATGVSGTIEVLSVLPGILEDVTITGPGADQLEVRRAEAAPNFRMLRVAGGATTEIARLTIANGRNGEAIFGGAGILIRGSGTLTLREVVLTENVNAGTSNGANGGGIMNEGILTLVDSTLSDNTANGPGGGIYITGPDAQVTIHSSTVSGNVSLGGTGCTGGGGIFNRASLVVVNSTVSGNEANSSGGGIITCPTAPSSMTVVNSTIASNSAPQGANLAVKNMGASALVRGTIVTDPRGGGDDCYIDPASTTFTSGGYNLASDGSCALGALGDQANTDPLLMPLADNGGPSPTHALSPDSPAIDQGTAVTGILEVGTLAADQRGEPRPLDFGEILNAPGGDGTDIGAYELQTLPPPLPDADPPAADAAVHFRIATKRIRLNLRRGLLRIRLACLRAEASPPCAGTLVLRTRKRLRLRKAGRGARSSARPTRRKRIVLGKARYRIGQGKSKLVTLRLGARKAGLLRRKPRARRAVALPG